MCANSSTSVKSLKSLFLILEAIVFTGFLVIIHDFPFGMFRALPSSRAGFFLAETAFLFAWLFLLILSPFFLHQLRGVAFAGWMIGVGILLYAVVSVV
jgi:hypothetical protein